MKNESTMAIYAFLLFIVMAAILDVGRGRLVQTLVYPSLGPSTPNLVLIGPVVSEEKIFKDLMKYYTSFA